MRNKILIKIVLIIILIMLLGMGNVKAVYQSTPYTHEHPQTQTWDTWLTGIRTMETTGGAMGLTETLNGTAAKSDSNNIDVHMMKATEYGAVALLSASPYGNINNTTKPVTSTGDTAAEGPTGVYYNYGNWEFTACIAAEEVGNTFNKYWDKYNTLSLRGLSPSETWHGGSAGNAFSHEALYQAGTATNDNTAWGVWANSPVSGHYAHILSVGQNGLFSYNWNARGSGYRKGKYLGFKNSPFGNGGQNYYEAVGPYSGASFYARGAAVNMEGI